MNRPDPEAFAHTAACAALGSQECYPGVQTQKPDEEPTFPSIVFTPVGENSERAFEGIADRWMAISFDIRSRSYPEAVGIDLRLRVHLRNRLHSVGGLSYAWDPDFRVHRRIVVYRLRF